MLCAFFQEQKLFTVYKHFHGAPPNTFPPAGEKNTSEHHSPCLSRCATKQHFSLVSRNLTSHHTTCKCFLPKFNTCLPSVTYPLSTHVIANKPVGKFWHNCQELTSLGFITSKQRTALFHNGNGIITLMLWLPGVFVWNTGEQLF